MAHRIGDRVKDTTATYSGTGNVTFNLTPDSGYQDADDLCVSNGDTIDLCLARAGQWTYERFTRVSAGVYSRAATPFRAFTAGAETASQISLASGSYEVMGDIGAFFAEHLNTVEIPVASAATTNIGAAKGMFIEVTGSVTISLFDAVPHKLRVVRFSGAPLLTHGTSISLAGLRHRQIVAGQIITFKSDASGNWKEVSSNISALPRGYIDGLICSNNVATPASKLDVSAGACRDSTNSVDIVLTAAGIINWLVAGADGSAAGAIANAWYNIFAISKADGTSMRFADVNFPPTLPSGYLYYRRIALWLADGTPALVPVVQDGDVFRLKTPVNFATDANPGTNLVTRNTGGPTGVRVQADMTVVGTGSVTAANPVAIYVHDLSLANVAATVATGAVTTSVYDPSTLAFGGAVISVMTDTSAQIGYRIQVSGGGGGTTTIYLGLLGWTWRRGKDNS